MAAIAAFAGMSGIGKQLIREWRLN